MKYFVIRLGIHVRRLVWGLIVAYMLGLHNFYYGDNKTSDNIVITIENQEKPSDNAPGGEM
jgi:hypothetical protein